MSSDPTFIVALGPRAILSLVGIITLVSGVWHADRSWDEKGSKAYERAYKEAKDKNNVVVPKKDLDASFPFPIAFLAGWALYGLAYFFRNDGSMEFQEPTLYAILAAGFSVALSIIASIPMAEAVKTRNGTMKKILGMTFVLSWVGLTITTINTNDVVPKYFCPLGAITIVASMNVLWKFRKMGDSWEQFGKPNPNPIVYNMGGPMFVFGWFLYWIGMAGNVGDASVPDGVVTIPIYYTWRTVLAFSAGCGMVPVVMMVDYAHDEGAEFTGFGTDGRFFGFGETPIPFLASWTVFGIAALLPVTEGGVTSIGTRQWIALANCMLQGYDAGILIQTALYKGDMAGKTKYSIPFVLLFMALAINIGWHGGVALALSLPGAVLIILGQKTVFGDRKRGDYFMLNNGKTNPNPIVYSAGEPLFMLGWIMISLAMSMPMSTGVGGPDLV